MARFLRLTQALSLGTVLALAAALACGFLTAAAVSVYSEIRADLVHVPAITFREEIRLLPDGTPIVERQNYDSGSRVFLDQHRQPLEREPEDRFLEPERLDVARTERPRPFGWRRDPGITRLGGTVRGREEWYFVTGDAPADRGYFVGYDIRAGRRVGYFGADGFQHEPIPPERQFRIEPEAISGYGDDRLRDGDGQVFLLSGSRLLFVDLAGREVRRLTAGDVQSTATITAVEPVIANAQTVTSTRRLLVVRTRTQVEVYGFENGALLDTYPIPESWQAERFWFHPLPQGDALFSRKSAGAINKSGDIREFRVDFARVAPSGEESTQRLVMHHAVRPAQDIISDEFERNVMTAAVPAPLSSAAFALFVHPWATSWLSDETFREALADSVAETWPALTLVLAPHLAGVVSSARPRAATQLAVAAVRVRAGPARLRRLPAASPLAGSRIRAAAPAPGHRSLRCIRPRGGDLNEQQRF